MAGSEAGCGCPGSCPGSCHAHARARLGTAECRCASVDGMVPNLVNAARASCPRDMHAGWHMRMRQGMAAGATLALGGPGERARARQMLEKAALLKAEWAGSQRHPSMMPLLASALRPLMAASRALFSSCGVLTQIQRYSCVSHILGLNDEL